jgi:DNA-binding CsgD family transcriptional regulator
LGASSKLRIAVLGVEGRVLSWLYTRLGSADMLILHDASDASQWESVLERFQPDLLITGTYSPAGAQAAALPDQIGGSSVASHGPSPKGPTKARAGSASVCSAGSPNSPHLAEIEFTGRQKEVLGLLYKGLTNDEMARHLGLSVRTIKGCLTQLFAIFDVSNRTELIGSIVDLGLLERLA